jgi:GT2 family glycosyltransferase/glycosyltransferase involved in cell wall biosynthesis
MQLLVKLALMRIKLKREQKISYSIKHTDEQLTDLQKMIDPLINELDQTIKILSITGKERQRIINIRESVSTIKNSLSWKLGHGFVSIYDRLFFRNKTKSVFDKIDEEADKLLKILANGLDKSPEPFFYLDPAFRVPQKIFKSDTSPDEPTVSIIVLHNDNPGYLQEFLDSFRQHINHSRYSLSLIDFSPEGKGQSVYNKFKTILPLKFYDHEAASTFACAANAAVEKAPGRYIMFLRSDIILKEDIIQAILNHFDQSPSAGIIGAGLHFKYDGEMSGYAEHYTGYQFIVPSPTVSGPDDPLGYYRPEQIVSGSIQSPGDHEMEEYPAISGIAMMVRGDDFVAVGGFDENYLVNYADVDLCLRIRYQVKKQIFLAHDISLQCRKKPGLDFGTVFTGRDNYDLFLLSKNVGRYIKKSIITSSGVSEGKKLKVAIKVPIPQHSDAEKWGDYYFAQSLAKALGKSGFSTRIDHLPDWYQHGFQDDEIALVLRGLSRYYPQPGQLNLMWNISHPDMVTDEEYESFDHVFVASSKQAASLSRRLSVPVSVLYQCTDPEFFYPDPDPDIPMAQFLYISNYRVQQRIASTYFINKDIPVDVYGRNWENKIPDHFIKGGFVPNHILRKYYSRCMALINDHWLDMARMGFISNRLFDGVASGCPVISDQCDGISEIFGSSVLQYTTSEEFVRAVEQVRQNPGEYKKNAETLSLYIRKQHTFDNRASEICAIVERVYIGSNQQFL